MSRKRKSAPEIEHEESAPETGPSEDLEARDEASPREEAPEDAGAEESADVEEPSPRKLTRSEMLDMLAAKNELNARLSKENDRLEQQVGELNDRWMRSVAEFENYRRRTRKEWDLLKQQTRAEVIVEILGIVDDFERAFDAVEGEESGGFVEGFRLIYNNLLQTLSRMGVTELDALGQPFDPNFHMAVGQVERDDLDSGVVAVVVQKGYVLDETVIRPANVLVAK